MKKFLINVFIFSGLLTASMLAVFLIADGKSDYSYIRFTTGPQHSMILGTSRSAQGLVPSVLDEVIYKNKSHQFFNYSFSLLDSPYGPAYFESIKKKLDPSVKDGIFIVTVDPWSLSSTNKDPNDSLHFIENKKFMGKTKNVNLNPNIPYLVESYEEPYINILRNWKGKTYHNTHENGWLEIIVDMDSATVATRLETKIKFYKENYLYTYKFSAVRWNYLVKTISFLQNHGKVYLVRLPAHQKILEMEDELMPGFESKIEAVSVKTRVNYLSFRDRAGEYQYIDGNHLYKSSGEKLSKEVARWIAEKK